MILLRATLAAACLALPTLAEAQFHAPKRREEPASLARHSSEQVFPLDVTWLLLSQNGKPVAGEAPSFIVSAQLRATGFSGCNSFSMTLYPVKDQKLAAGAVALTHKTCDKPVMLAEHAFLVGLHSMPRWDLSVDGTLSLKGPTGTLTFRRGV